MAFPFRSGFLWIAGATLLVPGCGDRTPPIQDEGPPPSFEHRDNHLFVPEKSPLRSRLTVQPVTLENVREELVAPATVEAEPTRMAKIAPPLPGRVVKLFVHFGDALKQGDKLFTLDSPDLVAAQSDYLKAKSALTQEERDLARQKDLTDHGIGAEKELEQAQTNRDTAESELDRAATRLRLLRVGPGGVGGPLTVVSPIAGRVIDLATAPGQFQNDPAAILMIVADLTTVWLTANVQEKDIRRVHQGDDASATFAAYPGEKFNGNVLFVGDLLDPDTRTIKVRVAFKNDDFRLKPGMFATVAFRSKATPEIVVPTTAVVVSGDKSSAYIEVAPWTFDKRAVDVGEQFNDRIAVTRGLNVGDRVVATNAVLLP
jgi:cobalt-zinc-cadmium efflux system membrane fusion protein